MDGYDASLSSAGAGKPSRHPNFPYTPGRDLDFTHFSMKIKKDTAPGRATAQAPRKAEGPGIPSSSIEKNVYFHPFSDDQNQK